MRQRTPPATGQELRAGNPFASPAGDLAIVSVDTLRGDAGFAALRKCAAAYDLVVFDEAHKLSVSRNRGRIRRTRRYALAEALAGCAPAGGRFAGLPWAAHHLLLLTATPHMGREEPYHYLWRLLDPQAFATGAALGRCPPEARTSHFIRRTKEEMVSLDGRPLYRPRTCDTFSYDLTSGPAGEQALYDATTDYLRLVYGRSLTNSRTWWRGAVDAAAHADPALEVVLPERGELTELPGALLAPGALPELWPANGGGAESNLTLRVLTEYFAGGRTVTFRQEGYAYDDVLIIPRCSAHAVRSAVAQAVEQGRVWLTNGPTSVWNEPVPYGVLDEAAVLHPQPALIPPQELTKQALPNAAALTRALSQERRTALPWGLVRDSIKAAVGSRWLQLGADSGALNCGYDQAGNVLLERPERYDPKPPVTPAAAAATLEVHEMQDLAGLMDRLLDQSAGYELRFQISAQVDAGAPPEVRAALDRLLAEVSATLRTAPK